MIAIHWFRRDLRLDDNVALSHALSGDLPVLPVFIFDTSILGELPEDDARVDFIHQQLKKIHLQLSENASGIRVMHGKPYEVWEKLLAEHEVGAVYFNRDHEPYGMERDADITKMLESRGIKVKTYKDQVIFDADEVLRDDGQPYTVFTPYKRKWLQRHALQGLPVLPAYRPGNFYRHSAPFPSLQETGFSASGIAVADPGLQHIAAYDKTRDLPALDATTRLGPHLRFGTVGIRKLINSLSSTDATFLGELIWREFFMQVLVHYPHVVKGNFRTKYDGIAWRNDEKEFGRWCLGNTGYPLVDAGMRQLSQTGFMHNRIRMLTASFLCKHLLIDWRWGEAWFASKLLDYELSSNNGNWQWAAGTGCDAAPWFRIFNPYEQQRKFDSRYEYVRKWVPGYGSSGYPQPMVEHAFARQRAMDTYRNGITR